VIWLCWPQVETETLKFLIFQDRFGILLEMSFSGVAEQGIWEIRIKWEMSA